MFLSFHPFADDWIPYVAGRKRNCSEAFKDPWDEKLLGFDAGSGEDLTISALVIISTRCLV
jgi:hypothetical protein